MSDASQIALVLRSDCTTRKHFFRSQANTSRPASLVVPNHRRHKSSRSVVQLNESAGDGPRRAEISAISACALLFGGGAVARIVKQDLVNRSALERPARVSRIAQITAF